MEAVGLEQGRVGAEVADKAGDQDGALLFGDARVELGEGGGVVGAVVGGDIHPEEDDLGAGLAAAPDDLAEVVLGVRERLTAEGVVAAELDDEDFGRLLEHPVDPGETTGRGVAADPGVDDLDIEALAAKKGLDDRGKGLGLGETETRGQAVAEDDDADGRLDPGGASRLTAGVAGAVSKVGAQPEPIDCENRQRSPPGADIAAVLK